MPNETLPRPFGKYVLTAALGEDALGRVYRALRMEDRAFVRLRILETAELSNEALLDAIQENGEIHGFLKNPAIARGVDMDAVEGVPYIAWSEPSGRTLDALFGKSRRAARKIPVEHALLIVEKMATALEHAYNTAIDGDRTLHGLVWPGFVIVSDDGEIRLSGFGLAEGILSSLKQPRLAHDIAPYLAPEEKERSEVGKNSDVFSAGVILLEFLTGRPTSADPLGSLKGGQGLPPPPMLPEIAAVLRMTLGPAESRYKSSGDLRRELGKLLFSGPYSPSTFNLAFFLNDLFRDEIEAETSARAAEQASVGTSTEIRIGAPTSEGSEIPGEPTQTLARTPALLPEADAAASARRGPVALIGALVVAAAIAGGFFLLFRRPRAPAPSPRPQPTRAAAVLATPTILPELAATPEVPTTAMSDVQFRDEVSKRLALEVDKLEAEMRRKAEPTPAPALVPAEPTRMEPTQPSAETTAAPTAPPVDAERAAPTAPPAPTRIVAREGTLVPLEEVDSPPKIARIVKPSYPPIALKARVGGIVVLRVLVSEKGAPAEIEVLRSAPAGLTEAATAAVRNWTFEPARKAGVPVRTWMTVPIPFEP